MTLSWEEQTKIMDLIVLGKTYRQIAKERHKSFSTIKKYANKKEIYIENRKIAQICDLLDINDLNGKKWIDIIDLIISKLNEIKDDKIKKKLY